MSDHAFAPDQPLSESRRVLVHAGFWWRFLAFIIDSIVLLPVTVLRFMLAPAGLSDIDPADDESTRYVGLFAAAPAMAATGDTHGAIRHLLVGLLINILAWIVNILYFSLFESSRLQATPGKLACRLKVAGRAGLRISLGRALGRECAKVIAFMTVIGVLMVGWTRRKQGLHDMIAGTLVLRATYADPVVFVSPPAA